MQANTVPVSASVIILELSVMIYVGGAARHIANVYSDTSRMYNKVLHCRIKFFELYSTNCACHRCKRENNFLTREKDDRVS